MNFGSLMNEIVYGSRLYLMCVEAVDYILCVWRLLHMLVVTDVAMFGTLGLRMSNFSQSVFVLLKITSIGWILFSLAHRVATLAVQGHAQM